MSTLGFVPRSVQKRKAADTNKVISKTRETSKVLEGPALASLNEQETQNEHTKLSDEDLLVLLELAFSEYNVWRNIDLQRGITPEKEGFILFKHLFRRFWPLSELNPQPTEIEMVRCIRNSPYTFLETRMIVTSPDRSRRSAQSSTSTSTSSGVYEIRRKDWNYIAQCVKNRHDFFTEGWWDRRTIYIERTPDVHNTIPSLARYIQSLLSHREDKPSLELLQKSVQAVLFPKHRLASPHETPHFKGFAFIILDSEEMVHDLCHICPWNGQPSLAGLDEATKKSRTRVLNKQSWEKLKEEYLAYQRFLASETAKSSLNFEESRLPDTTVQNNGNKQLKAPSLEAERFEPLREQTFVKEESHATFPRNCLAFVRNIHPETNKTTLRMLFGAHIPAGKDGIDYVDFVKGINSCHLRLVSAGDTASLVSFFSSTSLTQTNSLDQEGTSCSTSSRIEVEMVQGKREELYWEKVPEKTKFAALKRLRASASDVTDPPDGINERKAKRRKRT